MRSVGQKGLHHHGRAVAAQGVANSLVEFVERHARVFLPGQHQQRAGIFLGEGILDDAVPEDRAAMIDDPR